MDQYPAELLKILQAKQETFFFREALELYIPPRDGWYVDDDEQKDGHVHQAIGRWNLTQLNL